MGQQRRGFDFEWYETGLEANVAVDQLAPPPHYSLV